MNRPSLVFALLLLGAAGSGGCAAIGLTLFGVGAGVSAGTGVSYTLDSIAYKTFTAPEQGLRTATLKSLKRMDIEVKENQATESGRLIVAQAGDRTIEIELDRLTSKTTRMRVNAKQGVFFKDRATAAEIIIQTERTLDDEPMLARETTPTAAAPAPKK
jgi:hypothetical protein